MNNNINYVILSKTIPYALDDTINYYYMLQYAATDCFKKYAEMIQCYISHFIATSNLRTLEPTLYMYLLDKGLKTLTHIFKLLLVYTKNLGLTEYYCKQTLDYYVEFIEQNMQENNEKIDYNNASKFCYIKTVYKLQKQYRKTACAERNDITAELLCQVEEKEARLFQNVDTMIELYALLALSAIGANANGVGANGVGANGVGANAITVDLATIEYHILLLTKDVDVPKLQFISDVIYTRGTYPLKYVYSLCIHLQQAAPIKATVLKKIVSAESKIRLRQESVDDYIKWLIA